MNEFNPGIEIKNSGSIIRSSSKALTVTSKNFEELRNQITEVYNKRVVLLKKLKSAKRKLLFLSLIHYLSYLFVVGFFYKEIAEKRKKQQVEVEKIDEQLSENFIKLEFADKSQLEKSWLNCIDAFEELMESEKIWDITYTEGVDKVKARTIAETATKRALIKRRDGKIEFVRSDLTPLFLPNANGPDLFFFPTFLILFKDDQKFGIFDLKEIKTTLRLFNYIEEGKVPNDTEVVDHTWKKSNKDGSRDKRFKNNYQIPIVKYGEMLLETESGLEESFVFSNFDAFVNFAKKYEYHVTLLSKTNLAEAEGTQEKEQPISNQSSTDIDKEAISRLMKISCFGLGTEEDIEKDNMLDVLGEVEEYAKDCHNPKVAYWLGIAWRNFTAWHIRGDERKEYLEIAAAYFDKAFQLAKGKLPVQLPAAKRRDSDYLDQITIAGELGHLLVDEAIIRDLDRAEKALEFVFENTDEYESSLCSYADLFYKKDQYEKSAKIGLNIHKRAKNSSEWKDDPPPAPMGIVGKAYRALAKKAKKEERLQEAIEYFQKLKKLEVATENDLKLLSMLKNEVK